MTSPPHGRFEGREAFAQQVRGALAAAAREGWREIVLCDADFADWPLGERAVAQHLHDWSASGRRCTLIAQRWDEVARRHARFVSWRRTWSHLIEARGCAGADRLELPSAIWSPGWAMQRLDPDLSVGHCGDEPKRCTALRELLDLWLAASSPAFPATTFGL